MKGGFYKVRHVYTSANSILVIKKCSKKYIYIIKDNFKIIKYFIECQYHYLYLLHISKHLEITNIYENHLLHVPFY